MARSLFVILLTLLVLVACLWQGNRLATDTLEQDLLLRAEHWARLWVRHLRSDTDALDNLLSGQTVTDVEWAKIQREMQDDNIFRFKLFDSDGHLILDTGESGQNRIARAPGHSSSNMSPGLKEAFFLRKPVTELFSDTGSDRPDHFAETYFPIVKGPRVLGVVEVYTDVTHAAREIQPLFKNLVLSVGLLMVSGMLVPLGFLIAFWLRLQGSNKRLEASRQRAEKAERTKAEFLANMSHEIRTPMNGVIAMAELLEQSPLDDEQRSLTRTISQSSVALLSIINDILDFSKAEAGKMRVHKESFDLLELVQDAASLFHPAAAAKSVEVIVECTVAPPVFVVTDPARLRQCLLNVIGNAVKFTPQGHVHIWIGRTDHGEMSIKVTDTGVGIPEDMLDHIFEEFSQIEDGRTRRFEGTGLGLAITLRLTRLMGGTLSARSRQGIGSVFEFRFPFQMAEPPDGDRLYWADALRRLTGRRVMIVEPLEVNRRALRNMMGFFGVKPVFARDCEGARSLLTALIRQQTAPDLCLIDNALADSEPEELRRRLGQIAGTTAMPCVLMIGGGRDVSSNRLTEMGFAGLLRKPLGPRAIAAVMCATLDKPMGTTVPATGPGSRAGANGKLEGKTILVAEDNATNRLVIQKLLATTGVRIEMAENGHEALDLFRALQPDLVLMDVSMPVMNGYVATQKIRASETRSGLAACPIIALTANALPEDKTACHESGMSDFLAKPVRRAELLSKLDAWLLAPETGTGAGGSPRLRRVTAQYR